MNHLLVLGIAVFGGYIAGKLVSKLNIPSVTGYLVWGFVVGVSVLRILNFDWLGRMSWLIEFALSFVAFNVGGELSFDNLRKLGPSIFWIVTFETFFTYLLMLFIIYLLTRNLALSFLIAAIGAATAPAVTVLVIDEYRADGPLTKTLLACVGIDDAYGLMLYAVSASVAHSLVKGEAINFLILSAAVIAEIATSLVLGLVGGVIMNYLLERTRSRAEVMTVVLGVITFIGGLLSIDVVLLGRELHFSPLLAAMAMGFYVANFSRRKAETFRVVEIFGPPFYIVYFVLAAAQLQLHKLIEMGKVAAGYIFARIVGKYTGAFTGATLGKAPSPVRFYTGLGLISQAGIAIGLSVLAASEFPSFKPEIIAIGMGTTIITELLGPFMARFAIFRAGEAWKKGKVAV